VGDIFIYTTVVPMSVVMVMNLLLFFPIVREIQNHIYMREKTQRKHELLRRVLSTFSCSLLLGLTWLFGFFIMLNRETARAFEWLFCIFNSLQGFFIFVFHVLRNKEAIGYWRHCIVGCSKKYQESSATITSKHRLRCQLLNEN